MNWIGKLPEYLLYPIDWYLRATEWVEGHPHLTLWLSVAAILLMAVA